MQSQPTQAQPPARKDPSAPKPPTPRARTMSRRNRLILIVAGSIVGVALLALLAVNLLISADWARERVANRIKEQTGRELTVNGTTALLFAPGPRVVITDAAFTDPEARAGTTDFSVGRLVIDLSLIDLLSRNVDSERIVLERPVVTVRLGDDGKKAEPKPKSPKSENPPEAAPRRQAQGHPHRGWNRQHRLRRERQRAPRRAHQRKSRAPEPHHAPHRLGQVRLEGGERRFQLRGQFHRRSPREEARASRGFPRHQGNRCPLRW